jgi:hypothetical protein
MTQQSTF